MAKLNWKVIRKLEDEIAHDNFTFKYLKYILMKDYKLSAMKAKKMAIQIEKDGCEYWHLYNVCDI